MLARVTCGRSSKRMAALCCLLVAGALLTMSPGSALAKSHSRRLKISVAPSGQELAVRISSARFGARCSLRVSVKKQVATFTVWRIARSDSAAIKWTVPTDAPSGTWSFVAT